MPRRSKGPSKAPQGKPRAKAASSSATAPAPLDPASRPTAPLPSPSASAINLPQRPNYYRSALMLSGGIMVIAILLYAVVREASLGLRPAPAPEVEDPLFEEVRHRDEFKDWISNWRAVDPYVSAAEFTQESKGPIVPARPADDMAQPSAADLEPPLAARYVWSPDHSRYVDYLASFGEPDSTLDLYGRLDSGLERLAFCGTPCRFDGAFWLDADRVAVFGRTEGLKQDGTPLCLPTGAAEERRCYDRLTIAVYDLSAGDRTTYRSENHLFATDPYAALSEARWASGLSAEEQASMGVGSAVETIQGEIIDVEPEGRILTLGGARVPRFLAVSEKATIRDEAGEAVPFDALHRGFTVEARAVRQTDGTSLAAAVKIVLAPNIIVDVPADGADVGNRFAVQGIARTFESNVQLRLLNDRTGKTVLEKFTTAAAPDVGKYGPFSFDLRLPTGSAKVGDALTLEVYDTSAMDGAKIDLVVLHLVFRP